MALADLGFSNHISPYLEWSPPYFIVLLFLWLSLWSILSLYQFDHKPTIFALSPFRLMNFFAISFLVLSPQKKKSSYFHPCPFASKYRQNKQKITKYIEALITSSTREYFDPIFVRTAVLSPSPYDNTPYFWIMSIVISDQIGVFRWSSLFRAKKAYFQWLFLLRA